MRWNRPSAQGAPERDLVQRSLAGSSVEILLCWSHVPVDEWIPDHYILLDHDHHVDSA